MEKPPYQVPTMAEVRDLEPNGYRVISTFSGCGGSCLGFKMAGFRALYANEFVPAAADTYRANHPEVYLDTRDIRTVSAEEILDLAGVARGEIDVLEGSPPCSDFSTAGKRAQSWGKVKAYSDTRQRSDDLFFEYVRLVEGIQPRVFVAENVSGLVKGVAKGYFIEILQAFKKTGYRVGARLVDAQWLGVPQARQRIIFIGVREDLGLDPVWPKPFRYRYSVRDALPWIVRQAYAFGDYSKGQAGGRMRDAGVAPSPTIGASPQTGNGRFPPSLVEVRAVRDRRGNYGVETDITDEPAPTVLADSAGTHWIETVERFGTYQGDYDKQTERVWKDASSEPSPTIRADQQRPILIETSLVEIEGANGFNGHAGESIDEPMPTVQASRVVGLRTRAGRHSLDEPAPTVLSHGRQKTRSELTIEELADQEKVDHGASLDGYAIGEEWDKTPPGGASSKYFSLKRPHPDRPSQTVTATGHITGAASVTHPTERRKFSIPELRRICAFPDDFVFTGTYAQQWERMGRAVPPLMMRAIASTIRDEILRKADTR